MAPLQPSASAAAALCRRETSRGRGRAAAVRTLRQWERLLCRQRQARETAAAARVALRQWQLQQPPEHPAAVAAAANWS